MIARLVTLLPQPDSPTSPRRLALLELEADAVDGVDGAVVGAKPDDEVLDREERVRRPSSRCIRGSSDSRRPSPSRLNPIALITIAAPGKNRSHGAWRRNLVESVSIVPHSGGARVGRPEAQEAEARDVDDRGRQGERRRDDERRQRVRQQVPEQQPRAATRRATAPP